MPKKRNATLEMGKHPSALWWLSWLYGLFIFSFSAILSSLVIYLHQRAGVPMKHAYTLFAVFVSLIWTLPLIGGFIAERLSYRFTTGIGLLFCIVGTVLLADNNVSLIEVGLAAFVVGNAFFTPAVWCLVDHAYRKNDKRRESGFTLFYLCFNVGAMSGIFANGFVAKYFGYTDAFAVSTALLLTGLISFFISVPKMKFDPSRSVEPAVKLRPLLLCVVLTGIALILTLLSSWLLAHPRADKILLLVLSVLAVVVMLRIAGKQTSRLARQRVYGFMVLVFIAIVFFTLYNMEPSMLSVFVKNNVIKHVFGIAVPAESFFGFECLAIIVLGLLFSKLWWYLARQQRDPALSYKFALSLVLIGGGFIYLMFAIHLVGPGKPMPMLLMIVCYLFFAAGELLIGPLGISMVGRLSPKRCEGFFMGVWQMVQSISVIFTGMIASTTVMPKGESLYASNLMYSGLFAHIGLITIGIGLLALIAAPKIKKLL